MCDSDMDISVFDYEIAIGDADDIVCAVETIREHHPSHVIWVQL